MPSLERFFDPQIRKFDLNIKSLPGARFYFFQNGTTTPRTVYQDKAGTIPHTNPVIADSSGSFAPIFLDGLYRVELRSNANIVQPGWPIDNVGQDSAVVPFGPWIEILTYNEGEVVTGSNGNWYRSKVNGNLGNDPTTSPAAWEVIPIPVASSFTSDKAYLTWSDDGDQISLDVDIDGLGADALPYIEANISSVDGNFSVGGNLEVTGAVSLVNAQISGALTGSANPIVSGDYRGVNIGGHVVMSVRVETNNTGGTPDLANIFTTAIPVGWRPLTSPASSHGFNGSTGGGTPRADGMFSIETNGTMNMASFTTGSSGGSFWLTFSYTAA